MKKEVDRKELTKDINQLLDIYSFDDYGPNGLQIEGKRKVKKIAFAVSATRDSIEKAVKEKVDTMIVHHGLFWKFHGTKKLVGAFAKRVFPLVKNDINLLGYHLPLDAHMEYGNAATIADKIDLLDLHPFGDHKGVPIGVWGKFKTETSALNLKDKLAKVLNHSIILSSSDESEIINTMGIITGGANSAWRECLKNNLDSYLTGEMSEHDWHESKESGIHMFAGGHNATEQLGIQKLMTYIENKYQVKCLFIPSDNPA